MIAFLGEAAGFALSHFAEPIGVAVVASLVTAKAMRGRDVAAHVGQHDRDAAAVAEDLRRWIVDRDRVARVQMQEIAQQASVMGVGAGGTIRQAAGKVYTHVLHDYRDEVSRAQRRFDGLFDSERQAHARTGVGVGARNLSSECRPSVGTCLGAGGASLPRMYRVPTVSLRWPSLSDPAWSCRWHGRKPPRRGEPVRGSAGHSRLSIRDVKWV